MARAHGSEQSANGKMTREELEDRFRNLQKDLRRRVVGKAQPMLATGVAVAVVAVIGAYALGRSSGRRARRERD